MGWRHAGGDGLSAELVGDLDLCSAFLVLVGEVEEPRALVVVPGPCVADVVGWLVVRALAVDRHRRPDGDDAVKGAFVDPLVALVAEDLDVG